MEQKQSILLVDGDQEFRTATEKMLRKWGYDVATARDGRDALDSLSEKSFDLIISEVRMPVLDGIKLMEEINRRRIEASVLYITGHGEIESYMDLMNMGALDYLNKPVKERDFTRIVRRALGTNLKRRIPLNTIGAKENLP